MKKYRNLDSSAFISLICYSLAGRKVNKILPKTFNQLCSQIAINYMKNEDRKVNVKYSPRTLAVYIQNHSKYDINMYNSQLFQNKLDKEGNVQFVDNEENRLIKKMNTMILNQKMIF